MVWDVNGTSTMHAALHNSISRILKHLILLFAFYIWGTMCSGIPAELWKQEKNHLLQKLAFQTESKGKKAPEHVSLRGKVSLLSSFDCLLLLVKETA